MCGGLISFLWFLWISGLFRSLTLDVFLMVMIKLEFRPSWFGKVNQAALTKQVCITKTVTFPPWNQRLSIPSLFITMIHVRATFRSNNSLKFPTLSIWTTQHLRLLSLWKDLLNLIPTSSWSSNVLHVVFTPLPLSARGLNLPPNLQKGVFYIKNKLKSEIFNDKTSL